MRHVTAVTIDFVSKITTLHGSNFLVSAVLNDDVSNCLRTALKLFWSSFTLSGVLSQLLFFNHEQSMGIIVSKLGP